LAVTGDNAQFIVEAYTNSPSCYPYATTPNCGVICTPWRSPFTKSASCTSVPHVYNYSMQLNPADLYTVPSPMWSVGTVSYVAGSAGQYVGKYFPERKDNYDMYALFVQYKFFGFNENFDFDFFFFLQLCHAARAGRFVWFVL
jgi:hypothetical protein